MDCSRFIDRLDALVEGRLGTEERARAAGHLETCRRCRELWAAFGQGNAAIEPPADLAQTILDRTSGSPCSSATERLGDHVDGRLEPIDAALVRMHLAGCAECAALVRVLERMSLDLPLLAERDPGPGFVEEVLARTAPVPEPKAGWADRLTRAWQQLMARPRIAWEVAYVGTMILTLAFFIPGSPLAGGSRKALGLARRNPVVELREPVERIETRVASNLQQVWAQARNEVAGASRGLAGDVARVSVSLIENVREDLGTLRARRTSELENHDDNRPGPNRDEDHGGENERR